jgi:hypothetical protein
MDELAVVRRTLGVEVGLLADEVVLDLVVNGVSLADRWLEAEQDHAVPLSIAEATRRWGRRASALVQDGRGVPVLRCTCGDIGCGGAVVDVTTSGATVTWSALEPANGIHPSRVGPFTFARDALIAALTARD